MLLLLGLLLKRSCCGHWQPVHLLLLALILLDQLQQDQTGQRCALLHQACLQCWVMASVLCSVQQTTRMNQCSAFAAAAAAAVHPAEHLTPHLPLLLLFQPAAAALHLSSH
jgi:hypothetical protein